MNISFDNYLNNKDKGDLIDIRNNNLFNIYHINGSINIPINDILYNINVLSKDKVYYMICESGKVSFKLSRLLNNLGFHTYSIDGGYKNI